LIDDEETQFLRQIVCGHYYVDRLVGTGSFAWVYHAFSQQTGREVAIKILSSDEPTAAMRFAREIEVLRALPRSPNVVGFVEEGRAPNGWPLMVLEFIDGITLRDGMNRCRALAPQKAVAFMTELCGAFVGMHQLGVAHRDIKPENVLLPRTGGIKLIDFGLIRDAQGLLKLLEAQDPLDRHLFSQELDQWTVAGTPEYMAPEQFADAQIDDPAAGRTDTWSDVFSLGVIFYQLITGQKLFPMRVVDEAEFPAEMLAYMKWRLSLTDDQLPGCPGVGAALESILRKALRQDPRRRQPDARALLEDLKRWERSGAGVSSADDARTQMVTLDQILPLAGPGGSTATTQSLRTLNARDLPDFDAFDEDDDDRTEMNDGVDLDEIMAASHADVFFVEPQRTEETAQIPDYTLEEPAEIPITVEETVDGYTIEVDDRLIEPETGVESVAASADDVIEEEPVEDEDDAWGPREQTPTSVQMPGDVQALLDKVRRLK
jgi:serine/threonine protein kinase